jgi:DNA topoisomerase-3
MELVGLYSLNTAENQPLIILTGTDATIAQHIQTIVDREYVMERMEGATKYLVPSTLGIGLIEGYNKIGFEKSLSKPQLRREVSPDLRLAAAL